MIALVWLLLRLVIVLGALAAIVSAWAGVLSAIAVLILARRRPPCRLRWTDFFRRGRVRLLAIAWLAGGAAQLAVTWMYDAASGRGLGYLAGAAAGVGVAAGCAYWLRLIFEGKAMKDIFDAIPADQRGAFSSFLAGSAQGTFADFSRLDQAAVIDSIRARVIGQDAVTGEVVTTAFRRAALRRPGRPLANFLFVGSTGVGKTELAKALAKELFGKDRMIDIRCNELPAGEAAVWRFVGPAPGYRDADKGGWLCREIARIGTGVILFDEIEKCDARVLQSIMTLLDEGTLTEQSTGQKYDARGFLIVLTSNACAQAIGEIAAATADPIDRDRKVKDELVNAHWLPEVLGRIDGIFPFKPLDRESVAKIAWLLANRVASDAGVELESIDAGALIDFIEKQERVSKYGIRQLDKMVERAIGDGLLALHQRGVRRAAIRVIDGTVSVEPMFSESTPAGSNGATA